MHDLNGAVHTSGDGESARASAWLHADAPFDVKFHVLLTASSLFV